MLHLKPPSVWYIEDEKLCRVTKISTLPYSGLKTKLSSLEKKVSDVAFRGYPKFIWGWIGWDFGRLSWRYAEVGGSHEREGFLGGVAKLIYR